MAKTKVRRVRVGTRLSVELRAQLTKYCAASGISERTVIEDALSKHLHNDDNTALIVRRLDRTNRELAHAQRDLELLSEAFGRYEPPPRARAAHAELVLLLDALRTNPTDVEGAVTVEIARVRRLYDDILRERYDRLAGVGDRDRGRVGARRIHGP